MSTRPFEICGHRIPAGTRLRFDLPAAQLYTHTRLDMPVEVIHGALPGPVLLVCAAIHGDELNGVEIIRRLRASRSLNRLNGTLILVPVVNVFGFIHKSRYLPDRRDLNRCFPGSGKGSLASRLADLFFSEIVTHCDYIIDLHTAAIHRDNLPQVRAALDNGPVEQLARAFGMPVILNAGQIEGTLRAEAGKRNIAVITFEAGEALRLDERSIVAGVRGIGAVLHALGMIKRKPRLPPAEPYVALSTKWYRADIDGIFRSTIKLGERVAPGQHLGAIAAPFSISEHHITATREGVVIGLNNLPLVNEGEALFHIASFERESDVEGEINTQTEALEQDPLYIPIPPL